MVLAYPFLFIFLGVSFNLVKMDSRSRQLSMGVYYGFGCNEDTCATVQFTMRAWHAICVQYTNLTYQYIKPYSQASGSLSEGTSLFFITDPENGMLRSDTDVMDVDTQFQVYPKDYNGDYDFTKYCLQLKRSEYTRPGYCLVDVVGEKLIDFHTYVKHYQQKLYDDIVSSSEIIIINNISNCGKMTSPALTFVNTSYNENLIL